jgi:signal transduction histidine kinase
MRHVARVCFDLSLRLARTALGICVLACGLAQAGEAVHITSAQWQLAPGGTYGPVPTTPSPDPAAWKPTTLPHQVERSLAGASQGIDIAWFRLEVPERAQAQGDLRLYLPRWQTIGHISVYADGRLLFRSQAGPVWNGFNHPLWIALPQSATGRPVEVLVRMDHERGAGLSITSAWAGSADALAWRRLGREIVQAQLTYVASTAFLVIGLFALLVWVARREAAYGLFFTCSVFFFVRSLHYHLGLEPLPIGEDWFGWLTVHSLPALAIGINIFALRLAGRRHRWVEGVAIALTAAAALTGLPPLASTTSAQIAPALYGITLLGFGAFCIFTIASTWRAGSRDGLLVAIWNVVSVPAGVHDWLLAVNRSDPESVFILPLASVGLFSVFLFIVLSRYVRALRESEQAQQRLEHDLRAREAELQATYERLRTAERKEILSTERERLMQDMHDGLGSSLMSALKDMEMRHLDDVADTLRHCVDDLKLAIDSLEPVEADLLLLLGTLRFRLGARLERAGVQLRWDVQEDLPRLDWLDPTGSLQILRILQEVFTNILKHSGASHATVTTRTEGDTVVVAVEDAGQGFDMDARGLGGRGITNVRRRAQAIGATAQWMRGEAGMRFELRLPVEGAEHAAAAHLQVAARA